MGLISGKFRRKNHLVRIACQQNVLTCPPEFLKEFGPGAFDENGLPRGSRLGSNVLVY